MNIPRLTILMCMIVITGVLSAQDSLFINEFMASNTHSVLGPDRSGFPDWIEIFNGGSNAVEMGGLFLTDDLSDPFKWQIPVNNVIDAGSFFIIWADGLDSKDHAPFKLSGDGEQIGLFYPDGRVIDSMSYSTQIRDLSYGRDPVVKSDWYYFFETTPGNLNDAPGQMKRTQNKVPEFSVEGGRYDQPFHLTLQAEGGNEIYYSTDGSVPNKFSKKYTDEILVENSMVICARVYGQDALPSDILTQSYILNEPTGLPVISIACPPEYLFDEEIGITPGICVEDELGSLPPFDTNANFWNNWERTVHIDYFSPDGYRGLNQDAGIAIFGGYFGRQIKQKAFTLYAREKYGDTDFDFPLIPSKQINSYRRFILRCSSNDYLRTFIRDAMMNTLTVGQMDLDYWGYQPAIVYINGEFWGLYNIREKMNKHYPESNYGIDSDSVELIEWKDGQIQGDTGHFLYMLQFIMDNDMSIASNYEYVMSLMDIKEYINYFITEIFVCNHDWLHQNIKCWRENGEKGKWRWLCYDLDWGFNGMDPFDVDHSPLNTIQWILENEGEVSELFRNLIANDDFRTEFAQRFVTQLNLTFNPDRVHIIIDSLAAQIAPDMPRQIERWGAIKSMEYWHDQLNQLHQFAEERPFYVFNHLNEILVPEEKTQLNLEVSNPEAGWITVFETPVPVPAFEGEWYRNIPIQVNAQSHNGWHFVRWEGLVNAENDSISLTLDDPGHLIAVFKQHELPHVVINEIHYNPSSELQGTDNDFEFIELLNADIKRIDLSGYRFSDGIDFTFNQGIYMDPGEFILLAKNASAYSSPGLRVFQFSDGSLDNAGERLVLKNNQGVTVDLVQYDDHYPWPREADGKGPSLELINAGLDNNLASSWHASSDIGGTPGNGTYTGRAPAIKTSDDQPGMRISPNPFYDRAWITFSLFETCHVLYRIYNAYAEEVAVLLNEIRSPGNYYLDWEPVDLPSGIYFIQFITGSSTLTEPVIYMRK